ncbi:antitoxin Xre/MbcA/ParS toxin-binding domain-containing protein [Azohydromonas lata]|uniref:antitoxin Xre/MbcA/ParS toxin-binding domain-containing protein n=1 Tax=Azohydromonas lata TaxID=45677 RepID=UPI000A053073|nr:antitoxin Xre/MbcA/ParS toxin-binding domain-containing protein [Azohydromonas lata]
MTAIARTKKPQSPVTPPVVAAGVRSRTPRQDAGARLWGVLGRSGARNSRAVFHELLGLVTDCPPVDLYDAVEEGVPTAVVSVIAGAFGGTNESVMALIGVSETTFRRKHEASEPLPEVAGHRVMGFLRIVARLQRLLQESGDPAQLADFDLDAWVRDWMREPLAEFGGKTPAQMLRNPEGQRAIEELLDRMRGGLPA